MADLNDDGKDEIEPLREFTRDFIATDVFEVDADDNAIEVEPTPPAIPDAPAEPFKPLRIFRPDR